MKCYSKHDVTINIFAVCSINLSIIVWSTTCSKLESASIFLQYVLTKKMAAQSSLEFLGSAHEKLSDCDLRKLTRKNSPGLET